MSVHRRQLDLKLGSHTRKFTRWTPEEDAMLLEKARQGLSQLEISHYVPGRSIDAIAYRLRNLRFAEEMATQSAKPPRITDADLQRIIDMRLNEHMTFLEISMRLGRSYDSIRAVWSARCRPLLSREANDSIRAVSGNLWLPNEVEHLVELYNQGKLSKKEMALHFPSRTLRAVQWKLTQVSDLLDQSRKPQRPSKISEPVCASARLFQEFSTRRGLQLAMPNPSLPNSTESTLRRTFSSSSRIRQDVGTTCGQRTKI